MTSYRRFCALLCIVSTVWATSPSPDISPAPQPTLNKTAYAALCERRNFELKEVCPIDMSVLRSFDPETVDVNFVEEKVFFEEMVNKLSKDCPSGQVCQRLWDRIGVDRIKMDWRDVGVRQQYCKLTPCLTGMLEEDTGNKNCLDLDRDLAFRAFRLLCQLTEETVPDAEVSVCTDAIIELLQYNAADLRRNDSTTQDICSCSLTSKECVLPDSCRGMVKKYFCLSQRCSIDAASYLSKFKLFAWYFQNEQQMRKQFHLHACDEEIVPMDNTPPFVVAVLRVYGMKQAAIAATVGILLSCITLMFSCYIYKRYYRPRYIRDRNQYTEMKDNI